MRRPVLGLLTLLAPFASGAQAAATPPTITVTAHASRRIPADRATILIAVETRASTSAEAGSMNAAIERAVRGALTGAGVPEKQITTAGYMVGEDPRRDLRDKTALATRFLATNSLRVEISDLDHVGRYIDAALGAGATRIASMTFTARNVDETRREVLAAAMAMAKSDAGVMATAASRTLGPLLDASTSDPGATTYYMNFAGSDARAAGASVESTPITPREIEVVATVSTRWQLDPAKP